MNIQKIKELGGTWKMLNEKYDNLIVEVIDAVDPAPLSSEKLEEMKELQDQLFDLEVELYKVLQGE